MCIGRHAVRLNGPRVAGAGALAQPWPMQCVGCGGERNLASGERVGFRDECAACGADLHICRNCRHHDVSAYNEWRESSAVRVADRERANRCEYFAPAGGARASADSAPAAKAALDALFRK